MTETQARRDKAGSIKKKFLHTSAASRRCEAASSEFDKLRSGRSSHTYIVGSG